MNIFAGILPALETSLKYSSIKHELIAQNIANADTPNYKGKRISFQKVLDDSVARMQTHVTDPRHFELRHERHPSIGIDNLQIRYRHDGNSVDIDKEMADLAANQIYFHALSDRLNGKFQSLKDIIQGGK